MKALLYCVKSKPYLHRTSIEKWWWNDGCYEPLDYREGFITLDKKTLSLRYKDGDNDVQLSQALNGKIVASCDIDKVEEIVATKWDVGCGCAYYQFKTKDLLNKSCLKYIDLANYLDRENGYALHLTNLKVFDNPKELSEYCVIDNTVEASSKYRKTQYGHYGELIEKKVFKVPQNMQVVFENGILVNHYCNFPRYKYVLISIQPQHLCNILNGKKTIEVRRKVLNCLKEELDKLHE